MSNHAASTSTEVSFPAFEGEPHYVEGYVPCSYDSPHSSLHRTSTWLGMGLILSSVVGIGMWVFGLGSHFAQSQALWKEYIIIGVICMLTCWILGAYLIHRGRRFYRAYRSRTGRIH